MKKKSLRKILAASVAAMLMCAPMMAVNTAYASSITITDATENNTYEVYQIFSGTVSDGKLTNLAWSSGFGTKSSEFIALLAGSSVLKTGGSADFSSDMTAEQVAAKLASYGSDDSKTIEFGRIAAQFIKAKGITATATVNSNAEKEVSDGYYLVVNKTTDKKALSRSILKVAGAASITGKVEFPTIDKKIGTDFDEAVIANTAAIGDKIPYIVKSTIPDMTGYSKYYYIINDTMDPGLTYDVTAGVKIGVDVNKDGIINTEVVDGKSDTILEENVDYYVEINGNKIKIVFKDFINRQKDNKGLDIITTYSATLNENAELGTTKDTANLNKVNLVYSNNPNYDYKGTKGTGTDENPDYPDVPPESDKTSPSDPDNPDNPDNPDSPPVDHDDDPSTPDKPSKKFDEPVGITPYEDVVTYTTSLDIMKKDGSNDKALAGVGFTLSGDAIKTVNIVGNSFTEDNAGTYYKLKDGTFTTTAPTSDDDIEKYDDTTKKYKLTPDKSTITQSADVSITGTTAEDGSLFFQGLNAGTYILSETSTPAGYNKINDITYVISADITGDSCTWSVKNGENTITTPIEIINNKGSVLPSTGGIGTTIFYVSGGILVLGSAVLLITKKRMSLKDEK